MKGIEFARVGFLAVLIGAALSAQSPSVELQRISQQATVTGDLQAAIDSYKKIVARTDVSREVAAQTLLRMAECYEKLGDSQARAVYEQLVRNFADQKDAVTVARTRLASQPAPAADVQIRWRGPEANIEGTISADGRYLSHAGNWKNGDLAIRDLVTGTSRRLTGGPGDFSDFAQYSAISRDGKQVAYAWYVEKTGRYDLRVLPADATPQTTPRVSRDNPELRAIYPYDWSPDGQWIAVSLSRSDRTTQIGLVATRDLSITVLKSVEWLGPTKMFFSPDGRYLAYDLPASDASKQRDIFVLAMDGHREVTVVAHPSNDAIMGWAADGRSLLFASNRTGAVSLWTIPLVDGKPTGTATLLRPDIGPVTSSLGVTAGGGLVLGLQTGGPNIYTVTVEPSTGKVIVPPTPLVDGYLQTNRQPAWSPDGKALAYLSMRPNAPSNLVIQFLESGRTTELQPLLSWFLTPQWAPDGSITVSGTDLKGRRGIHRIDATTGQVSPIVTSGNCAGAPSWPSDGRLLIYQLQCGPEVAVMVRDMATGAEREIAKAPGIRGARVSPDGRQVAYARFDPAAKAPAIMVIPTEGGIPRQFLQLAPPTRLGRLAWSADGRRLLVIRAAGLLTNMLSVPLDGGATTEVPLDVPDLDATWHPDGRRLAFDRGVSEYEVRVVDLKLPASARR